MKPQRSDYGALDADLDRPLRTRPTSGLESGVGGDFDTEIRRKNAPHQKKTTADPTSSQGRNSGDMLSARSLTSREGTRSWWRAGIVTAAAATAFSAAAGISHYAMYTSSAANLKAAPLGDANTGNAAAGEDFAMAQRPPSSFFETAENPEQKEDGRTSAAADMSDLSHEDASRAAETKAAHASGPSVEADTAEPATTSASSTLAFVALNEYTRRGDVVGRGYSWLDGNILVEPHRVTSLEVVSPREGRVYSWKIVETGRESYVLGEFEGNAVDVVFFKAPHYTVILVERQEGAEEVVRSTEVEVHCKYVRREIRSLFDDERTEMFDAMKVLWDVKTEDGMKLYGDKYLDVWSIDMFHQVGASDLNCDHLHDGIGFGITHSMVTMMFENSLQLVNPKLSLPYWDFTIEGYLVDSVHDGDYTKLRDVSDLWTEEWFGSVDPEDFQVKDGRWAYMEVPILPQEHRDLMGADVYGRMRSPWNVNDRPYLTRGLGEMCGELSTDFYGWPSCEKHYDLTDLYTSYYGYTWQSQYQPHGPVHVWIGGNVDCKKDMEKVASIVGEEYQLTVSGYAFIMRKDLFRSRDFRCHGFAEADIPAMDVMKSGQCGCTELNLDEGDDYLRIYETFAQGYDFPEFTESEKRQLAIQYCNGVIGIGESSQSSSPLDPTFWSLHPTMERLLSFKLLTGTFADYSWPDEPGTWKGMDGKSYEVVISLEQDECYGHRGSDIFPYGILKAIMTPQFTFHGVTGPNTLTNRELIHLFDPSVDALPYIYDNFEWSHCAASGFDFKDFFDPDTGMPGPKGGTVTPDEVSKRSRIHGYGIFEEGKPINPLYYPTKGSKVSPSV